MLRIRGFREADAPVLWALNDLPNVGHTADPSVPLPLPPAAAPSPSFPDLRDIGALFDRFLVATWDEHPVGMGGIRLSGAGAEVLRVRVHPAMRRRGVGRALMTALEGEASGLGAYRMHLDTATNQPEAMAFYRGLGYAETRRETRPEWSWTLAYFEKHI